MRFEIILLLSTLIVLGLVGISFKIKSLAKLLKTGFNSRKLVSSRQVISSKVLRSKIIDRYTALNDAFIESVDKLNPKYPTKPQDDPIEKILRRLKKRYGF